MGRAPCCDKGKVKKGPWSPDEDATLKSYVGTHGTAGSWIALPRKAGLKRCGKSCRLRWLNYLRPNIKHGDFTEDEDNVIFNLYNQYGSRWSTIASQLPGRTDNDVKNHWNTKLKKKMFLLAGKTKLQTESDSKSSLAPETESHATGFTSPSLLLGTLTEFNEIINYRPISDFAGDNSAGQFEIPTISSPSFSKPSSVTMDRHASVTRADGDGRDEWGLMGDWGCDFQPDVVLYSMLFKEKNGELCL